MVDVKSGGTTTARTTARTTVVDTVTAVPCAEWDALAGQFSLYHGHAWLRSVENDGVGRSRYVLARGSDGRLLGVLPVHRVDDEINPLYRPGEVLSALPGPWHEPALVFGTRRGYHNELMIDRALPADDRRAVVTELLGALPEVTGELGMRRLRAMYATTETVSAVDEAAGPVVPILTGMDAVLTLPGEGFDDYLRSFGSHRGSTVKEIDRFARAGYEVGMERLRDTWREAGPLMNNVERRHGNVYTDAAMIEVVRRQAETLDDIGRICACRRDGRLVAFSLFAEWGDALYMRMVGFDYPNLADAYEYFNVLFYAPIRYAYANGFRRLYLGIEGYRAKVVRRAQLSPLWTFMLPRPDGPAAEEVRAWNRGRAAEIRDEFARHGHAMTDSAWALADRP